MYGGGLEYVCIWGRGGGMYWGGEGGGVEKWGATRVEMGGWVYGGEGGAAACTLPAGEYGRVWRGMGMEG